MRVILLQDVPKVGHKYEVKEIADGYARNFLLPRGLAEIATEARIRALEAKRAAAQEKQEKQEEGLRKAFADLHGQSIHLAAPANERGHLFRGVKAEDIAAVLSEKCGIAVDARHITRQEPIKETGEYEIELAHGDARARFTLFVKAEEEAKKA